jgi:hypothetical protein
LVVCETALATGVEEPAGVAADATVVDGDAAFAGPDAGWLCATRHGNPATSTAKTQSFLTVSSNLRGGKDLLILNDGLI